MKNFLQSLSNISFASNILLRGHSTAIRSKYFGFDTFYRTFPKTRIFSTTIYNRNEEKSPKINKLNPYLRLMRVDKPIGTYLLTYPALWGVCIGSSYNSSVFDVKTGAIMALGAFLMRSAGVTINDIWDRKIDSKVERTKNRPLASGELSLTNGIAALAIQLGGAASLLYTLNTQTQVLGLIGLPIAMLYPLAKRFTQWPQAVLGVAMNWGMFMGFSSLAPLDSSSMYVLGPLFASAWSWTMFYDTIYAFQDIRDDMKIKIGSSAKAIVNKNSKKVLYMLGTGSIVGLTLVGYLADLNPIYYGFISGAAAHLNWQVKTLDLNDPRNCGKRFKSNSFVGGLVTLGLLFGNI